jgi:hypothetical protein
MMSVFFMLSRIPDEIINIVACAAWIVQWYLLRAATQLGIKIAFFVNAVVVYH